MRKHYNLPEDEAELRKKIVGLGEKSVRKCYYPVLQKKLEHLERFKLLLDQSNDAIFLIDLPSGRFLDVSESACKQIGFTEEECFSRTLYDMIPDIVELNRIFSGATESLVFDTILKTADNLEKPYEISMRKVRLGNKDHVVAIARDITKRRQAEKELIDAKRQAELYLDLMGHDINNINQTSLGFLELADEKLKDNGQLTLADRELVTIPIQNLKNSAKLIENLRKIQKEQARSYETGPVDVNAVLAEVLTQYSAVPEREVKFLFRPACDCTVLANPLLKDVFSNLVGNAIKHSTGPLTIDISTSVTLRHNQRYCRISIEDTGPGIPDDRKRTLFDFSMSIRQKIAGKGLGLYLVKTLVDDFHGKLSVEDRVAGDPAQGCRFVVELPAIAARAG